MYFHHVIHKTREKLRALNLQLKEKLSLDTIYIKDFVINGIHVFLNEKQNFVDFCYTYFINQLHDESNSYSDSNEDSNEDSDDDLDKESKADTYDSSKNRNTILDIGFCDQCGCFGLIGNFCTSDECNDAACIYE